MAKKEKDKPHIKKFKHDSRISSAMATQEVLVVIEELKAAYPDQASKVRVVDVHLTEMYGRDNQHIIVKYIYVDKPNKGVQEVDLDEFTLQEIIDRYLSK